MRILIFGSSITWGAWDEHGGWAQRLKNFTDKKAATTDYQEYAGVYCLGVDGDNTDKLLFRFDTEVKARLDEEKTLILIEIGINDSQYIVNENLHRISPEKYKQNLLSLLEKAKSYSVDIIFIGLTPVDSRVDPIPWGKSASYRLEFVKTYDEIIKNVCKENNIPYIELLSKFSKDNLLVDGLHPNTEGHRIIYEEVKGYLEKEELV